MIEKTFITFFNYHCDTARTEPKTRLIPIWKRVDLTPARCLRSECDLHARDEGGLQIRFAENRRDKLWKDRAGETMRMRSAEAERQELRRSSR